jgi:hypothetical protein
MLQMRDYSLIPMTPHKWENWDCCPDQLRIDLNHKPCRIQEYSGNRYASNEIGVEFGLNQMEAKLAVRMYLGKDMAHKTDATMRAAMQAYVSLIPKGADTIHRFCRDFHHSVHHMERLVKKYQPEPVAVLNVFKYYDVATMHSIFEQGL